MKGKLNELATNNKNKNIRDLYSGRISKLINLDHLSGYQPHN
jgi:hypothetical protein